MLATVYLAGIAAPINQFKVPPVMNRLMQEMGISLAESGWLMSSFAVAGFILALPSGMLLRKVGVKTLGSMGLILLLTGSVAGGLAKSAFPLLLSRVMEGAGMSFFSVAAPAAITAWFASGARGKPMGIWATWVPAGNVVIFTTAPFFSTTHWQNAWIFSSVYTAAVLAIFIIIFRIPETKPADIKSPAGARSRITKEAWLLALIFMLFNMITISIKTYVPVFLENFRGFPSAKASGITTVMMICSMITAPLAGALSDKIHSRSALVTAGCIGAAATSLLIFSATGAMITISLVIIGIAGGLMPAGIFTAATELSNDPQKAGTYMSAVIFGQYAGMFAGPVYCCKIADTFSWQTAAYSLLLLALTAFAVNIKLTLKGRKT